jgi:hypothetical protein
VSTAARSTQIEPILGWRIWHVDPGSGRARLRSWAHSTVWPAGRRMEAQCRSFVSLVLPSNAHEAPRKGHSCGIYALRDRGAAEAMLHELGEADRATNRLPAALGRVSLWGRVMENTGGWRGQFAYPYDLLLFGGDEALAAQLRGEYAVDVALAS